MRAFCLLVFVLLLAGCGDDPAPTPTPPVDPGPDPAVYLLDGMELGAMIAAQQPGGMAWIPASTLETMDIADAQQRAVLLKMLTRGMIVRLVLYSDGTHVFDLRREMEGRLWRTVKATGTWTETADTVTAVVATREHASTSPVEIPDTLTFRRKGKQLWLDVIGRTIPLLKQRL